MPLVVWDLWIPDVASRGLSFGRGILEATPAVLVHSAPTKLRVEVRDIDGHPLALGDNLQRRSDSPMTRLRLDGEAVRREETWPTDADLGLPVILPGGEVGALSAWWNSPEHNQWRWSVEFSNRR